jgi:hypothetical protein
MPAGVARCPVGSCNERFIVDGATPIKEVAMLYALLALMAPLWSDTRPAAATPAGEGSTSASHFLVIIVAALCAILVILLVDLHRDRLRASGLFGDAAQVDALFMSP